MVGMPTPDLGCRKFGTKDNPMTVHHIVAKDIGGSDHPTNLMLLCQKCNSSIGTK